MKRIFATLGCDLRLQWRNGFFAAAAFVVVIWVVLLYQVGTYADWVASLRWLLPAMLLNEIVIVTFYFVGGQVLLEKAEGSLLAQSVAPLRPSEYIWAKVITLTLAGVLQNLLVVAVFPDLVVRWLPLIVGLMLAAALFVLAGLIAALRAHSVNEYLLPSTLYVSVLLAPLLPYIAGWDWWWLYVHPVHMALGLVRGANELHAWWYTPLTVLYCGGWIVVLHRYCLHEFRRFVVAAT